MSLQKLPSELVSQIFSHCPTLLDLRRLAGTSQYTYAVFKAEKIALIYKVLANELGPVLPDALGLAAVPAPLNASCLRPYKDEAREIISKYKQYLAGETLPSSAHLTLGFVQGLVDSVMPCFHVWTSYGADRSLSSTVPCSS